MDRGQYRGSSIAADTKGTSMDSGHIEDCRYQSQYPNGADMQVAVKMTVKMVSVLMDRTGLQWNKQRLVTLTGMNDLGHLMACPCCECILSQRVMIGCSGLFRCQLVLGGMQPMVILTVKSF